MLAEPSDSHPTKRDSNFIQNTFDSTNTSSSIIQEAKKVDDDNSQGYDFAGLGVAIVTPFRDGHLDRDRLREQIEFQINAGTNFLVPVGTTGNHQP